ncbi:PepSY domain-containing protein [Luteimonas sp. RC10]|uniref:PepSY domain-containing protein n=1 Tax=Luteimonas sp. RC10 TaxID=2587035 RepID=UPI00160E1B76|nr:PepSY domain-containing protein [Luteimonas sp. RC10]MBB3343553.1 putative membrane protein YkoI [Luteimonas sp. RC10]
MKHRLAIACLIAAAGAAVALPAALAQNRDDRGDRLHAAAAAQADPRSDANTASLDRILADAQRRHPGRVIEVSYDDGEYDVEIRQNDGRIVELEYSARTGRLLDTDYD